MAALIARDASAFSGLSGTRLYLIADDDDLASARLSRGGFDSSLSQMSERLCLGAMPQRLTTSPIAAASFGVKFPRSARTVTRERGDRCHSPMGGALPPTTHKPFGPSKAQTYDVSSRRGERGRRRASFILIFAVAGRRKLQLSRNGLPLRLEARQSRGGDRPKPVLCCG
jgi:hypothetical protein